MAGQIGFAAMYLVEADRQRDVDGNKTGTKITVLMDRNFAPGPSVGRHDPSQCSNPVGVVPPMVYEFRDRAELDEYYRTAAGLLSV